METLNLMQQALGDQWQELPAALRAHYQTRDNTDTGTLEISYPRGMQWYLNFLRLLGALVNRQGKDIPTTVAKTMKNNVQFWTRTIQFSDGKVIFFKSHWVAAGDNKLIEYVNPILGLCMAVRVEQGKLYYVGQYYVVKLGKLILRLPEWLVLGHTTIEEVALDEQHFTMDFRLTHPWFGLLFRYAGKFTTQ